MRCFRLHKITADNRRGGLICEQKHSEVMVVQLHWLFKSISLSRVWLDERGPSRFSSVFATPMQPSTLNLHYLSGHQWYLPCVEGNKSHLPHVGQKWHRSDVMFRRFGCGPMGIGLLNPVFFLSYSYFLYAWNDVLLTGLPNYYLKLPILEFKSDATN